MNDTQKIKVIWGRLGELGLCFTHKCSHHGPSDQVSNDLISLLGKVGAQNQVNYVDPGALRNCVNRVSKGADIA